MLWTKTEIFEMVSADETQRHVLLPLLQLGFGNVYLLALSKAKK